MPSRSGLSTVCPQINIPAAIVRQNNPSQRRRASAGVGINRSVSSRGAVRQPKLDGGPPPPDPTQGASLREESSRIGSWTTRPVRPHARPNAAAYGGPDSGAGVSPVSAGVSPAWVFAGETPAVTAGTAAPLRHGFSRRLRGRIASTPDASVSRLRARRSSRYATGHPTRPLPRQ